MSDVPSGRPPKSAERIRESLHSVHKTIGGGPESGQGLQPQDQIVIAVFYDRQLARQFQSTLTQSGIMSSLKARRQRAEILVDAEDRERAAAILVAHRAKFPDQPHKAVRPSYDLMIFGSLITGTLGMGLLANDFRGVKVVIIPVSFAVIGALVGHLFDRFRMHLRSSGRLQFGVREFLIAATLPPILLFLWHFIRSVIKQ